MSKILCDSCGKEFVIGPSGKPACMGFCAVTLKAERPATFEDATGYVSVKGGELIFDGFRKQAFETRQKCLPIKLPKVG
jgi:hypothetical protein